jgi:hypothetical protein
MMGILNVIPPNKISGHDAILEKKLKPGNREYTPTKNDIGFRI